MAKTQPEIRLEVYKAYIQLLATRHEGTTPWQSIVSEAVSLTDVTMQYIEHGDRSMIDEKTRMPAPNVMLNFGQPE